MVADPLIRRLTPLLVSLAGCAMMAEPTEEPAPPAQRLSPEGLIHRLEEAQERLPLDFALAVTPQLIPMEHASGAFGLAFYVPLPPPAEREEGAEPPIRRPAAFGGLAPLLADLSGQEIPDSARGLLFVNRAAYSKKVDSEVAQNPPAGARATDWKSLLDLPVDSVEYLFHALLQAHLEVQILPADGDYAQIIEHRAAARMAEVPAEHRRSAYIEAVASFGAHVLAVANEAERAARRRQARGSDLCAVLDRPGTLFALWLRIFTDGRYTGRYYRKDSSNGNADRWLESNLDLEPEDKALFLTHILGDWWGKDPEAGLRERYCGDSQP